MSLITKEIFKNALLAAALVYTPLREILEQPEAWIATAKLGVAYSAFNELVERFVYKLQAPYDITDMLDTAGYVSLSYFVAFFLNLQNVVDSFLRKYVQNFDVRNIIVTAFILTVIQVVRGYKVLPEAINKPISYGQKMLGIPNFDIIRANNDANKQVRF